MIEISKAMAIEGKKIKFLLDLVLYRSQEMSYLACFYAFCSFGGEIHQKVDSISLLVIIHQLLRVYIDLVT